MIYPSQPHTYSWHDFRREVDGVLRDAYPGTQIRFIAEELDKYARSWARDLDTITELRRAVLESGIEGHGVARSDSARSDSARSGS